MREFCIVDSLDFLKAVKTARARILTLQRELEYLQSDITKSLVDRFALEQSEQYIEALKDYYTNLWSVGFKALNNVEDERERAILLGVYFNGDTHARYMTDNKIPKQTYWAWHNKGIRHFRLPDAFEMPEFPNEPEKEG